MTKLLKRLLVLLVFSITLFTSNPAFAVDTQQLYLKNRVSAGPIGYIQCLARRNKATLKAVIRQPLTINNESYDNFRLGTVAISTNLIPQINPIFPDELTVVGETEKVHYYHTTRTILNMEELAQVDFLEARLTGLSSQGNGPFTVNLVDNFNTKDFAVGCPYQKDDDSGWKRPNNPSLQKSFQDAANKIVPFSRTRVPVGAKTILCIGLFRRPC